MLCQASALEHSLDFVVSHLVAKLSKQIFARSRVHKIVVELSDRMRHAVLLKRIVVSHPRTGEDEKESIFQFVSFPSFSSLILLPEEL